jgi:arylsulfatase A-like enzyme
MMSPTPNIYRLPMRGIFLAAFWMLACPSLWAQQKPNIILIYADDFGYGDASCYGATQIKTPNLDRLAASGIRFTHAHATSATCTPSRYSLLTGQYAWRKPDTGIAPGNAAALIQPGTATLASVLQRAGYQTGVVGKWHLGLGPKGGPDWNNEIKPGPQEIGFSSAFVIPATVDRVPCVYVENHRVVSLDRADPIRVSYTEPIGSEPTGKEHPELLKMKFSHRHDQTIVNGISRIGYMEGGKAARWVDEDIADVITGKANDFIEKNQAQPFFLYFATHDIHVPRAPHSRFAGKSKLGPRGDVILQLDWSVGEIMKTLDRLHLSQNTIIIFSSDNGPVLNDGYVDEAVEKQHGHLPGGPLRGGKYSAFDAGTRVPLLIRWPGHISPGISDALVSQVDFVASFAALTGQKLGTQDAPDSFNALPTLLGKDKKGREYIIEQSLHNTLALIQHDWKYIEPSQGPAVNEEVNIELGNDPAPQLYHLKKDMGEKANVAAAHLLVVKQLADLLNTVRTQGRSRQ